MSLNVVILGAGNVGVHLAKVFTSAGHYVNIWSRTAENAKIAAENAGCQHIAHPSAIARDTDICIAALSEDALYDVCQLLPPTFNGILAHTAGSVHIDFLQKFAHRTGVFYPLQTFTKDRTPDYKKIPVFIESNSKEDLQILYKLCSGSFTNIKELDSPKRKILHLAAVFACNFVNASMMASEEIAESAGLDFSILQPLIEETIEKLHQSPASQIQWRNCPAIAASVRLNRGITHT